MADIVNNIYSDLEKEYSKDTGVKQSESFTRILKEKDNRRKIIVVDPIGLQPIITTNSLSSKGNYKKYSVNSDTTLLIKKINVTPLKTLKESIKNTKKVNPELLKKPCPEGKIRNVKSGRCIKKPVPIKKVLKKQPINKELKKQPINKEISSKEKLELNLIKLLKNI